MGVQISKILPKREIEITELLGKAIAVDAFLWLHQFLSIIRQSDGTPLKDSKGRITSHLSGAFYRSAKLLEKNIKLVWVFDGEKPDLKFATMNKRKNIIIQILFKKTPYKIFKYMRSFHRNIFNFIKLPHQ